MTSALAISGLGGIGKTQVAIEYAYQYGNEYQSVLWARAESREVLTSDFAAIGELLHLEKEKEDQDQVQAVKRWLESLTRWLLILDNADDPQLLNDFIPLRPKGHVLITALTQFMGPLAQSISFLHPDAIPEEIIINGATEPDSSATWLYWPVFKASTTMLNPSTGSLLPSGRQYWEQNTLTQQ